MTQPEPKPRLGGYALGGYEPQAGLSARQTRGVQKLPVPSLLRSLLSEHLDPGYAAAAAARAESGQRRRRADWAWQAVAALLVAAVFAAAMAQARSTAPGVSETQRALAASVQATSAATDELTDRRNGLAAEVDAVARRQLVDDAEGNQLLDQIDTLGLAAAAAAVIGPGLTVTVTEPGAGRDLTDVSKQRLPGSQQVILDRDLQLAVNALWGSGAEAISVGGVRIGPNVTIRQAGGAILVDNRPISSPYQILAIGPPNTMAQTFERSSGLRRLRLLETSYGVGVTVSAGDGLAIPAGTVREVTFARSGPR